MFRIWKASAWWLRRRCSIATPQPPSAHTLRGKCTVSVMCTQHIVKFRIHAVCWHSVIYRMGTHTAHVYRFLSQMKRSKPEHRRWRPKLYRLSAPTSKKHISFRLQFLEKHSHSTHSTPSTLWRHSPCTWRSSESSDLHAHRNVWHPMAYDRLAGILWATVSIPPHHIQSARTAETWLCVGKFYICSRISPSNITPRILWVRASNGMSQCVVVHTQSTPSICCARFLLGFIMEFSSK